MSARKIDIIFFRHGLADWPRWKGSDDERPLNEDGKHQTHEVAAFLASVGLKPKKILTSPLPRAFETAEIVAEHLQAPVETTKRLGKGFSVAKLKQLLDDKIDIVMLVGHEPDFSRVIKKVTGGEIKLRKSGVTRVLMDRKKMSGQLEWLLAPTVCRLD